MKNNLISIIVPVYNAENYLDRCLNSLVHQTYKNLEIIIVNDGSTDSSKEICDNWASKDTRIKVVHKNNGGVSSARNEGIKYASGYYLGWVDSDDWIEPDMYDIMLRAMQEHNADICIVKYTTKDRAVNSKQLNSKKFDSYTAQKKFLKNEITPFLWDKVYKRSLFDNITFKGEIGEDSYANFEVFLKSHTLCDINYTGYHWVRHDDSLMTDKNKLEEIIDVTLEIREKVLKYNPSMEKKVNYKILHAIVLNEKNMKECNSKDKERLRCIKRNLCIKQNWIKSNIVEKKIMLKGLSLLNKYC